MTVLRFFRRPSASPLAVPDSAASLRTEEASLPVAARTAALPRVLWIELTSRCPYRCPFCSRETLRGHGRNMPLDLYERIVAQLRAPETLRLNYSGESAHYPHIVPAIALAASTGAWVELVSVPAAVDGERLAAMIRAGLNRLTVSLHTLDDQQFQAIYGFGTLATMLANVRLAAGLRGSIRQPFVLDFAFVATASNLDQLPKVATLAAELDIPVLAVHPIIRRTPVPRSDGAELSHDGSLQRAFREALEATLTAVRSHHPQLDVQVSTPEVGCAAATSLGDTPAYWPGPLPSGARLHSCDQDPFETLHVLADGSAVTCEVRDQMVVGNLATTPLAEVWHGAAMQSFRTDFTFARDPHCRGCSYKRAYRPQALQPLVRPGTNDAQLLHGWHVPDGTLVWSRREAALVLARPAAATTLALAGMLPAATQGVRTLRVDVDGARLLQREHAGKEPCALQERLALPPATEASAYAVVRLEVDPAFRPVAAGGTDVRELGFGLISAEIA